MIQRYILATIILSLSIVSQAQIKFGLRGGVNSSSIKLKNYENSDYKLSYAKGDYGFHLGVISQIEMSKFYLQPELLFTNIKNDIALRDAINDTILYGRQAFRKLDLPVIVGYKIKFIKLQAGPVASVLLGTKSKLLKDQDIEQDFSGATIGFQAGVGVELTSLLVDLKYEGNLSRFGSGMTMGNTNFTFDQRMSQIILSLGFLF